MPSTLDEALNNATETETSNILVIDNDLRTITVPPDMILGVYNDDDTHRLHFRMPKMFGDIDLSTFSVRVNYTNAANETDMYLVEDAKAEGDNINFSWLVGRTAFQAPGACQFSVCLRDVDSKGAVQREFNTTFASLEVLPGIEGPEPTENPEYMDIVSQLTSKFNDLNEATTKQISDEIGRAEKAEQANANGVSTNASNISKLQAWIGYNESDIYGVQIDYKNNTYTRLAGAAGKSGGADFDSAPMFGGRKRCNVADNGTVNAYYGDAAYKEDGSNGQVMVYQPRVYYMVVPLELEKQDTGIGYHLRKANYYVSDKPYKGFKLHPAFEVGDNKSVDHIFLSAFEGSVYDKSASTYLKLDEQVCDPTNDLLCSVAGVKPASGYTQNYTRTSTEQMAQNRGSGWHTDLIKAESLNQLLMLIEYAGNLQTLIEKGNSDFPWTGLASDNNSSYAVDTGGTSTLGNATGHADTSVQHINGQTITNSVNGKRSVTYRGMENPWGNLWKFVYGINIWGNGQMAGGEPYICKDFNFAENKNSGNYEAAGFTVTPKEGYISAMGYSEAFDWLFIASETNENSALPIGDYTYVTQNPNGYRIALLGGGWSYGLRAGGFCWSLSSGVGYRNRTIGGRLVYIPAAKDAAA